MGILKVLTKKEQFCQVSECGGGFDEFAAFKKLKQVAQLWNFERFAFKKAEKKAFKIRF